MKKLKKHLLLFLSILILITSTVTLLPKETDAFASKVIQQAAKKVIKEIAKDEAVKMTMNFVMNYKYTPPSDADIDDLEKDGKITKKKAKQLKHGRRFNYDDRRASRALVCQVNKKRKMTTSKGKSVDVCDAPLLVKKDLTAADKKQISNKVGSLLDKAMYNKGFMKFLNWFVPVWIVGGAITVIDLLLDGELSSFFSDLAYESLVSLGFISNLEDEPINITDFTNKVDENDIPPEKNIPINSVETIKNGVILGEDYGELNLPENLQELSTWAASYTDIYYIYLHSNKDIYSRNGDLLVSESSRQGYLLLKYDFQRFFDHLDIWQDPVKLKKVEVYSGYYEKLLTEIDLDNKNVYRVGSLRNDRDVTGSEKDHLIKFVEDYLIQELVFVEPPKPMPLERPSDIPTTKPNTTVKIPSPESVPVVDTKTGIIVKPSPNSTPEITEWVRPDGTVVPEEDIEVGEIEIEDTPDGDKIKAPEATPDIEEGVIPKPEPEIINPNDNPDDNPNGEDFPDIPDGESCDESIKKPRFEELGEEITTTFPFNIPFDLYQSFVNLFINIDSKKPEYDLVIYGNDFKIKIPDFFDQWRPFVHGLLIFVFDIGLLWVVYRFVKE